MNKNKFFKYKASCNAKPIMCYETTIPRIILCLPDRPYLAVP